MLTLNEFIFSLPGLKAAERELLSGVAWTNVYDLHVNN